MAAIAAGDQAAVFWLHNEFYGQLAAFMLRELRRLGIENPRTEEVDGLVIDACFVLFDCGGAWKPQGGALPWTWAARRLAGVASDWVGQHSDELDASRFDGEGRHAEPTPVSGHDDEAELEVLSRMAGGHPRCALVLEAFERVASRRDQAILLELTAQGLAGDPSPAVTVAARHEVSAEVVRQAAFRMKRRLKRLAAEDLHFADLADLAIVA